MKRSLDSVANSVLHSRRGLQFVLASALVICATGATPLHAGGNKSKGGQGGASSQDSGSQPASMPLKVTRLSNCEAKKDKAKKETEVWTAADNAEVSRFYNSGDWEHLHDKLSTFIGYISCYPSHPKPFDVSAEPFSVVFLDETLETPALVRVLVQTPLTDPFATRVRGFQLYDLQLSPDPALFITSHYQATSVPNPLLAQLSSVLSTFTGGLKAPSKPGEAAVPLPPPPSPGYIVSMITIPEAFKPFGASLPQVSVTDQLSSPALVHYMLTSLTTRALADDASYFKDINCTDDVCKKIDPALPASGPITGPITVLTRHLFAAFTSKDPDNKCAGPSPDQTTCLNALAGAMDYLTSVIAAEPAIDRAAAQDLAGRLYATFGGLANPSQAGNPPPPTQYSLGPLTKFAFSLGTAAIGPTYIHRPVKLTSQNAIVSNPPTSPLTFVALDWHPHPYDETTLSPSCEERFRVIVGTSITPNPGALIGVGFGLLRGLSAEGGYVVLLDNVLRKGERLGDTATHSNPTPRGAVGAFFLGVGYSLQ
jgi:hypothetical protein